MSEYPECEKMKKCSDHSQAIGEFLEWLRHETDFVVCGIKRQIVYEGVYDDFYSPVVFSTEHLLAQYFEIDLDTVEKEKRAMLRQMCEQSGRD